MNLTPKSIFITVAWSFVSILSWLTEANPWTASFLITLASLQVITLTVRKNNI